jgi:hypothetical protein
LFLASFFLEKAVSIQFEIDIPKRKVYCFSENLGEAQLVKVETICSHSEYSLTIQAEDEKKVEKRQGPDEGKNGNTISFTTFTAGKYKICIDNKIVETLTVDFTLKTGVEAKDYSNIANQTNMTSLELSLKEAEDLLDSIAKELALLVTTQENKINNTSDIGTKITMYGLITIVVLVGVAFFQTKFFTSYLKLKKYR